MGVGDVWNRALVYFGIVEEQEYWDDEAFDAEEELGRGYRERPNVRRLHSRRGGGNAQEFDDWSEPDDVGQTATLRSGSGGSGGSSGRGGRPPLEAVANANVRVHL